MRRVHYAIKLSVCLALVWVSLTLAASRLQQTALSLSATARAAAPLAKTAFFQQPPAGQWMPVAGPEGGSVSGFAALGAFLFAATLGAGVFRSSDGGGSWAASNSGLGNLFVNALLVQGLLLYAATNGGVYRSDNNGASWTPLNTGLTVLLILALLSNGNTLYAGSAGGGLFVSTNGGQSWTPMNNGLTNLFVTALLLAGTTLIIGTRSGVFRLLAGAAAWVAINNGLSNLNVRYLLLAGAFLFLATQGGGVFRSNNNGDSWLPVNTGLSNLFVLALALLAETLYAATQNGLYRSTNNGGNWTEFSNGLFTRFVRAISGLGCSSTANSARLANQPACTPILGTNGGGFYFLDLNQQQWKKSNRGLTAAEIRRFIRLPNNGPLCAATIGNGVHCTSDNGRTWTEFNTGLTNSDVTGFGLAFLSDIQVFFLCATNDGVHVSDSLTAPRWTRAGSGITTPFITDILTSNNGRVVNVATSNGVFTSNDPRAGFTPNNNGLPQQAQQVVSLALTPDGGTLALGGFGGVYSRPAQGGNWSANNEGLTKTPVFSLAATGSNLFAGADDGGFFRRPLPLLSQLPFLNRLFRNTGRAVEASTLMLMLTPRIIIQDESNAQAFAEEAERLATAPSSALATTNSPDQSSRQLLAGTFGEGVFVSNNNGDTWREANAGLANPFVMTLFDTGANLLAGTSGGGVCLFAPRVASVSAASFSATELAPESIVAAFGANLATATASAATLPLPTTLAGTRVTVKDSAGTERAAAFFFASPNQLNLLLPLGTANGPAQVNVTNGNGLLSSGTVEVARVAPGLFAANANGQGVAAAVALRVRADGSQSFEPVARFDAALNRFVPLPLELGPASEQVFLLLFGTGFRLRSAQSAVSARLGGLEAEVSFAGAQGELAGLDQANLRLPRSLAGRGEIDVTMTVDGKAVNTLRISVR